MPISDDEEEETDSENYDDKDDSDDIDFWARQVLLSVRIKKEDSCFRQVFCQDVSVNFQKLSLVFRSRLGCVARFRFNLKVQTYFTQQKHWFAF